MPTAQDLYLRGNNIAGFETNGKTYLETEQITLKSLYNCAVRKYLNFKGYTRLNVELYKAVGKSGTVQLPETGASGGIIAEVVLDISTGNKTVSLDISFSQRAMKCSVDFNNIGVPGTFGAIYRNWLS